jgi:hypothetical protein
MGEEILDLPVRVSVPVASDAMSTRQRQEQLTTRVPVERRLAAAVGRGAAAESR